LRAGELLSWENMRGERVLGEKSGGGVDEENKKVTLRGKEAGQA